LYCKPHSEKNILSAIIIRNSTVKLNARSFF
jgi:hypothetical protein